jgi:hypothetical protein
LACCGLTTSCATPSTPLSTICALMEQIDRIYARYGIVLKASLNRAGSSS